MADQKEFKEESHVCSPELPARSSFLLKLSTASPSPPRTFLETFVVGVSSIFAITSFIVHGDSATVAAILVKVVFSEGWQLFIQIYLIFSFCPLDMTSEPSTFLGTLEAASFWLLLYCCSWCTRGGVTFAYCGPTWSTFFKTQLKKL